MKNRWPLAFVLALAIIPSCKNATPEHKEHKHEQAQPAHEPHGHHQDEPEQKECDHDEHPGHKAHAGHNHAHPELALDELQSQRCEHDVATIDCDECRYELGVVKVPEEVAEKLIKSVLTPPPAKTAAEVTLRCESGLHEQNATAVIALTSGRVSGIRKTLGDKVSAGDVMLELESDEFAGLKLSHQIAHQKLVLSTAKLERLQKIQENLKTLLSLLQNMDTTKLNVALLETLEIGQAKADLMTAANSYIRTRDDSQRTDRLVKDGLLFIKHLRGQTKIDISSLKLGNWKSTALEARAELNTARKASKRADDLAIKGIVSRGEKEARKMDYLTAQARFTAALEQIELESAQLQSANDEARNTAWAQLQGTMEEVGLQLELQKLTATQEVAENQTATAVSHRTLSILGLQDSEFEKLHSGDNSAFGVLEVRAPASGTIIEQAVAIGKRVSQEDSLFVIANLDTLWVWCDIYDEDLRLLQTADLPLMASLQSDAFPDRLFLGQLDYLGLTADNRSRTVKARVVTKNSEQLLRPGMFMTGTILIPSTVSGLVLPTSAMLSDAGEQFVFLHWKDQFWVRRNVHVLATYTDKVVVDGINPGDMIATQGAFLLKSDVLREKMGAGCAD